MIQISRLTNMRDQFPKDHRNSNDGNPQLFIVLFLIIILLIILILLAIRLRTIFSRKNCPSRPNVNHVNVAGFSRYRPTNLRSSRISLRGHHQISSDLATLHCSPSSAAVFRLLISSPTLLDSPFCDRQPHQSFNNHYSGLISVEDLLQPRSLLTHTEQTNTPHTPPHYSINQPPPAYAEVVILQKTGENLKVKASKSNQSLAEEEKPPPSYQELKLSKGDQK